MGPKASVTYAKITGRAAYQLAKGEVSYSDVTATEIMLDAYSLTQRPLDQFSFLDLASLEPQKNTLDSLGFTDAQALAIAKSVVDSVGFSEDVDVLLIYERAFSDSFAISDFSAIALHKGLVDTVGFSDGLQNAMSLGKADTVSVNELHSVAIEKQASEALGVTDSFARVATYIRNFTDTFGLDELVNVSPNWGIEKTNVFSFTENFSYEVRAGHNSVLNSSALNTYTLNL